ncbi:MAG: PilN domain-containing protein [candidate division Zixibacteria bacterium]
MIEINLLPKELQWKRFSFRLDKKLVILMVTAAIVLLSLAGYSYVYQAGKIETYEKNIASLKAEADQFSEEIKQIEDMNAMITQMTARMTAIEILDRNRGYWVDLLEDVIRRVPEYLWLTSVKDASATIVSSRAPGQAAVPTKSTIEGFSFSLNAMATFIIRLKKSNIIRNVEISSINLEETEETKAYFFKLTCDFNAPEVPAPSEVAQTKGTAGGQF